MTFDEAFERLPADGWLTYDEAWLLWDTVRRTDGPILEVGSFVGRSTCLLAALGRPVYAVDPFDGFHSDLTGDEVCRRFLDNLDRLGLRNVELFRQPVEDWRSRPVGFAYLDGDHTRNGTLDQIAKALLCKPQAIAIHDVNDHGQGLEVKRAAVELLGAWDDRADRLAVWGLR